MAITSAAWNVASHAAHPSNCSSSFFLDAFLASSNQSPYFHEVMAFCTTTCRVYRLRYLRLDILIHDVAGWLFEHDGVAIDPYQARLAGRAACHLDKRLTRPPVLWKQGHA